MFEIPEGGFPELLDDIVFIIPVEDGDPHDASFLQGFPRSLMRNSGLVRLANTLPSNIRELSPKAKEARVPRRMSGQAPVRWYGQSPKALFGMTTPPFAPFVLLLLGEGHKIKTYQDWVTAHSFPLTVIAESGGTISYKDFSIEKLRQSFLHICDALEGQVQTHAIEQAKENLSCWIEPDPKELEYQIGGHNVTYPNALALHTLGYQNIYYGNFTDLTEGIAPYVEEIIKTTRTVLHERETVGERQANQYFRCPPSLNLFAPAIYPHIREISASDALFSVEEKKRFALVKDAIEKQEGYSYEFTNIEKARLFMGAKFGAEPKPHFLMMERAAELSFATECIGTLTASELSATIRLPNKINRTNGQVKQFAQQYRARQATERKRAESFRRVQDLITSAVPDEFKQFIESAKDGIRIIADAHLEWMNLKGLPLCIQKNVSRIPVTPGNLFISQISAQQYIHLVPENFSEILVLSAIHETDPISRFFDIAFETFAPEYKDQVSIRTVRIKNKKDLIEALNSFNGAMAIFDGHGRHEPGYPAMLQLLDEEIDIWTLQSIMPRVPPIVILSACDTHAADRNHASTANGLLAIGARAVLGSVFPINAHDASAFVARLLYRVVEYVPKAHELYNRSLTWMEIMSGMIRMQLLTDFCRRLEIEKIIDHNGYQRIHLEGNIAINSGADWPFDIVIAKLVEEGIEEGLVLKELCSAAANSTAISYLHLGRPETIIIHPSEEFRKEIYA